LDENNEGVGKTLDNEDVEKEADDEPAESNVCRTTPKTREQTCQPAEEDCASDSKVGEEVKSNFVSVCASHRRLVRLQRRFLLPPAQCSIERARVKRYKSLSPQLPYSDIRKSSCWRCAKRCSEKKAMAVARGCHTERNGAASGSSYSSVFGGAAGCVSGKDCEALGNDNDGDNAQKRKANILCRRKSRNDRKSRSRRLLEVSFLLCVSTV